MYANETEFFLRKNHIRFDYIIYEAPYGERILINDEKPSGLKMAIGINVKRDRVCDVKFKISEDL